MRPTVWPKERADRAGLSRGAVQGLSLRGQGRMPHSQSGPLLRVRTSWSDIYSARLPHYFIHSKQSFATCVLEAWLCARDTAMNK